MISYVYDVFFSVFKISHVALKIRIVVAVVVVVTVVIFVKRM
jgi:hypothetical protein